MTYAVPSGFCRARKRAVAIAQVKMCFSSTGMPIRCELGGDVAAGALAVVGEEQERDVPLAAAFE